MRHDVPALARLLRSFLNGTELRHFVGELDGVGEMLAHMPAAQCSLSESCAEAAALIDRWGMTDAELFARLQLCRPSRLADLVAYHRRRAETPTTLARRAISVEMAASIEGGPVGVYRIHPGQVRSVGRSSEAEIQFPGGLVKLSRLHAWVSWPHEGAMIVDLDSKNGTWVNGRRVTRAPLHEGDTVQLGEIELAIHEPDRTETASALAEDTLS